MGEETSQPPGPDQAAVRAELERILANAPFVRSPVLSRFLAHVVEHALACDGRPLKEYAIGLEVFDRPDDFDPRIDTIVRVQARRLRAALARYYGKAGRADPWRLDMPKGQYGIRIRHRDELPEHGLSSGGDGEQATTLGAFAAAPVPVPRTPLIGREVDLAMLTEKLHQEQPRLLTITGVGGVGKTRLALAVADAVRDGFAGGVLFVDLSAVTRHAALVDLLADVFKVRATGAQSTVSALAERMHSQITEPVLLILDNMEGVLDGADFLGELLDSSDLLKILVTSRVALRLYGEYHYPLAPLPVPDAECAQDPDALSAVPSVQLFLARAGAASRAASARGDLPSVARLCTRLDGLPLAIELVAAQAAVLNPAQMLQRFSGHLDLPENPARDTGSRQRTLRRVIDWSYEQLGDAARIALRRLAIFAGGFTLQAAGAVADAGGDLGESLFPAVNSLVAMGLVYFSREADEGRYAMLEALRNYGIERLNASGEADDLHKAHAAWCLVLAEEGVDRLDRDQRAAWLARCEQEQDNFRQALDYLLRRGPPLWALRMGQALFGYWERKERLIEGRTLLHGIVERVSSDVHPALWAKVASYAALLKMFQGNPAMARQEFENLLPLYRRIGNHEGEAATLTALAMCFHFLRDEPAARQTMAQALAVCRRLGEPIQLAGALRNLAESERVLGNLQASRKLLDEAHSLLADAGDPLALAWCVNHRGDIARSERKFDEAAECYQQAEAEFRRLADKWGMARSLSDRGRLALDRGQCALAGPLLLDALRAFAVLDHQRSMATVANALAVWAVESGEAALAMRLLGAAEKWRSVVGFASRPKDIRLARDLRQRVGDRLKDATIAELHQAGCDMSVQDVLDELAERIEERPD